MTAPTTVRHDPLVHIKRRGAPTAQVELSIDGKKVSVPEGSTILAACAQIGIEIPTLCYLETLHPVNVCRICVVDRSTEEPSSSSTSLRLRSTRSLRVFTTIPGSTTREQDGTSTRAPSSSTTQMRQTLTGCSVSR